MAVLLVYFLTPRKAREEAEKSTRQHLSSITWDPRESSKMFVGVSDLSEFEIDSPSVRATEVAAEGGAWQPRFSFLCKARFRRRPTSSSPTASYCCDGWRDGLQVTRSENDFRCLRASLLQKYKGVILAPIPAICHIMRKYYKTSQIITHQGRDYESFVYSCLRSAEIRQDPEFLSFLLVGQAEWQKYFKKGLPPIDMTPGIIAVGNMLRKDDRVQFTQEASTTQGELWRYQQFFISVDGHLKTLRARSVEIIERGQPAMSENKAGYDLVVGPRSTDAMSMSSMLEQLEQLRAVTLIGDGENESISRTRSGAWFGFKEHAKSNGQAKHIALLALYFETTRASQWVQVALDNMNCGAKLLHELLVAKSTHEAALESLQKRVEHEQQALKNEQQVEAGSGGLSNLTLTYFHGLSAMSYASDDQFDLSKQAVEDTSRRYEEWKVRCIDTLKVLCDAIVLSIEELTSRWVVLERSRYEAQAKALGEMATLTRPTHARAQSSKATGQPSLDLYAMISSAATEAMESEVWH